MTRQNEKNVALVTGIGLETVKGLAERGYTVFMGSRDISHAQEVISSITPTTLSESIKPIQLDISSPDSIKRARKEIEGNVGKLDALVNNAAEGPSEPAGDASSAFETYSKVLMTNVAGNAAMMEEFKELLARSDHPRIVNVSSRSGSFSVLSKSNVKPLLDDVMARPQYPVSKAALNLLTVIFAKKLALLNPNFKVNSVCPGFIKTRMSTSSPLYPIGKEPSEGAIASIKYATLDEDGPTGTFYAEPGLLPAEW